ncbi:4465_t:CDS:1, partial [Ambispora gerdemannii]
FNDLLSSSVVIFTREMAQTTKRIKDQLVRKEGKYYFPFFL